MSDGALSQEEIDSLLAGLDTSSQERPSDTGFEEPFEIGEASQENHVNLFKKLLDESISSLTQNLSMITGMQLTVGSPIVEILSTEDCLLELPEEVLFVDMPFIGTADEKHCFVLDKEATLKMTATVNKGVQNSEVDELAISAVKESLSTISDTLVGVFANKLESRSLKSGNAEAIFASKEKIDLPGPTLIRAKYQLMFSDESSEYIYEYFLNDFVKSLFSDSNLNQVDTIEETDEVVSEMPIRAARTGRGSTPPARNMTGNIGGRGMSGMPTPSVQPVQFANLQSQGAIPESGNIGLIMDVYMEMTVELGRTRKLIKEILGMGEGTIIELDKLAGEPVDILVNNKLIAKGEVVVIDENFGVRVTEIVSPVDRVTEV